MLRDPPILARPGRPTGEFEAVLENSAYSTLRRILSASMRRSQESRTSYLSSYLSCGSEQAGYEFCQKQITECDQQMAQ